MSNDVSSSFVLTEEQGTAWSNAPARGDAAARRRASPTWVGAVDINLLTEAFTKGTCHTFCVVAFIGGSGDVIAHLICHSDTAAMNRASSVTQRVM